MRESEPNYLERFAVWLKDLGDEVDKLARLVEDAELPVATQRVVIGAGNYLFKALDLVPDGIDDIGYLDDAFVLRVSAAQALAEGDGAPGRLPDEAQLTLQRLAAETDLVQSFLDRDYPRLHQYVLGLGKAPVRGRSAADIVQNPALRTAFLQDIRNFCRTYKAPRFIQEARTLVKLRAFFDAKLPK
jgi:uncharacterized membrane protein YkvA (DUF1232 family)